MDFNRWQTVHRERWRRNQAKRRRWTPEVQDAAPRKGFRAAPKPHGKSQVRQTAIASRPPVTVANQFAQSALYGYGHLHPTRQTTPSSSVYLSDGGHDCILSESTATAYWPIGLRTEAYWTTTTTDATVAGNTFIGAPLFAYEPSTATCSTWTASPSDASSTLTVSYTFEAAHNGWVYQPVGLKDTRALQVQRKVHRQLNPPRINHRGAAVRSETYAKSGMLFQDVSPAELRALCALKARLNPREWRRYLQYGFVVVTGKSGLEYRIDRADGSIVVFRRTTRVASLCIHGHRSVPPTDKVLTKMAIVSCDEPHIWEAANVCVLSTKHSGLIQYGCKPNPQVLAQAAQLCA